MVVELWYKYSQPPVVGTIIYKKKIQLFVCDDLMKCRFLVFVYIDTIHMSTLFYYTFFLAVYIIYIDIDSSCVWIFYNLYICTSKCYINIIELFACTCFNNIIVFCIIHLGHTHSETNPTRN